MLTLGLRSYRSSNLVLDLKMWDNFESNLPVWPGSPSDPLQLQLPVTIDRSYDLHKHIVSKYISWNNNKMYSES